MVEYTPGPAPLDREGKSLVECVYFTKRLSLGCVITRPVEGELTQPSSVLLAEKRNSHYCDQARFELAGRLATKVAQV